MVTMEPEATGTRTNEKEVTICDTIDMQVSLYIYTVVQPHPEQSVTQSLLTLNYTVHKNANKQN